MATKYPVSVFMPTRGRCVEEARTVAHMIASQCSGALHITQAEPVTRARNAIVRKFQKDVKELGVTHCLMIDDDTVPMDPFDVLPKLLACKADIAGAVVPMWVGINQEMIVNVCFDKRDGWALAWPEGGQHSVNHVGTACLLIAERVFRALKYPWFTWMEAEDGKQYGEDVVFCDQARAAGMSIAIDASVRCDHLKEMWLATVDPPPGWNRNRTVRHVEAAAKA